MNHSLNVLCSVQYCSSRTYSSGFSYEVSSQMFQIYSLFDSFTLEKQARKGFRPPSAMEGIGYFLILRNLLRNCLQIFWDFFGNFLGEFFWRNFLGQIFWEDFFGRIFLGGFFGRNSLRGITW